MKGKNAGKSHPARKRHPCNTPVKRVLDLPFASVDIINPRLMVYGETRVLELINLYWSDFSSVSLPHELTPESRSLIHRCNSGRLLMPCKCILTTLQGSRLWPRPYTRRNFARNMIWSTLYGSSLPSRMKHVSPARATRQDSPVLT